MSYRGMTDRFRWMHLFLTEKALQERDRITRMETILDAHDARMQAHEEECIKVRIDTKNELTALRAAIEHSHDDWREVTTRQHTDNIKRAEEVIKRQRWQIGLMITMILGVAGFIAEQMWARVFVH